MKNKVFGSILGGLFALWVAVFLLVVYPKIQEYGAVKKSLGNRVKSMEKYAKATPEELPTQSLLQKKDQYYGEMERGVDEVKRFHQTRDDRIQRDIPASRDLWVARYRDAYDLLGSEYRQATGLAEEQPLPFPRMEKFDEGETADYERAWRVQKLLVGEIIAAGGEVHSYSAASSAKERESNRKDDPRPGFVVDRVTLKGKIPPREMSDFLGHILGDDLLVLEVDGLVVGKDLRAISPEVVQDLPEGAEAPSEPRVLIALDLNVLTWQPEPEGEPAPDKGE
jgi:hypothetical protein